MCLPPRIQATIHERTARRCVPATFVGCDYSRLEFGIVNEFQARQAIGWWDAHPPVFALRTGPSPSQIEFEENKFLSIFQSLNHIRSI